MVLINLIFYWSFICKPTSPFNHQVSIMARHTLAQAIEHQESLLKLVQLRGALEVKLEEGETENSYTITVIFNDLPSLFTCSVVNGTVSYEGSVWRGHYNHGNQKYDDEMKRIYMTPLQKWVSEKNE